MSGLAIGLGFPQRSGGYDPVALFPGGTAGALYEIGPGTVWRDVAGTLAAVPGDAVAMLADRSGNGNHAVQASAAARPLLKVDGGGRWFLEFDGVDDFLRASFAMAQPWERFSALRQLTWGNGRQIFGGTGAVNGMLQQIGASANLRLYDGTLSTTANAAPVLGANEVIAELHNGPASSIAINEGAPVIADYGSLAAGGITIGGSSAGAQLASLRLYALAMRPGPLGVSQRTKLRGWMAARAGAGLS